MLTAEVVEVLRSQVIARLAMAVNDQPYVVPISYGYDDGRIVFHGRSHGRKLEMLTANPRVCFTVEQGTELVTHELPCKWSFNYRSLVAFGTASIIELASEKRRALDILMRQHCRYLGEPELEAYEYDDAQIAGTVVVQVVIDEATVKGKLGK